jgi:hypothetical protein
MCRLPPDEVRSINSVRECGTFLRQVALKGTTPTLRGHTYGSDQEALEAVSRPAA